MSVCCCGSCVLRSKLFPYYFWVLTICHGLQVATASALVPVGNTDRAVAMGVAADYFVLLLCLGLNVTNQFVVGPRVTRLMHERHPFLLAIEAADAPGADAALKEAVKKDEPAFKAVGKRFGMLHGISSLVNLVQFIGRSQHALSPSRFSHIFSVVLCMCVQ